MKLQFSKQGGALSGMADVRAALRGAFLLAGVLPCLASAPALAQEGDPAAGREVAETWCSRCHDIGPQGRMKENPPSFAAIALYRSPGYIRTNILMPHSNMPQLAQVLGLNADDLVAYITSLEKPCP